MRKGDRIEDGDRIENGGRGENDTGGGIGAHARTIRGDVAAVALLDDPQRRALYDLLRCSPEPMSREELVRATGLPRSTVAAQLDRLAAAGVLTSDFRKLSGRSGPGSGRPARLYRAARDEVSASVPDRSYGLAAALLAAAVEKSMEEGAPIQDAIAQVAFEAGSQLAAGAVDIGGVLQACGYVPEADGAGGYRLTNCPFHSLARRHTGVVCALNGALLNGALAGCGDRTHKVQEETAAGYCCAAVAAVG